MLVSIWVLMNSLAWRIEAFRLAVHLSSSAYKSITILSSISISILACICCLPLMWQSLLISSYLLSRVLILKLILQSFTQFVSLYVGIFRFFSSLLN